MAEKTYYEILGVALDATEEEIEEACWTRIKGLEMDGADADENAAAIKEFMAAYRILSNPYDRKNYDEEIRSSGAPQDLDTTAEYELPMGMRKREDQHFDIDDETNLRVLRTGGGRLTFTTTGTGQVVISGNPPPYAENRGEELIIAASDYNAELSLPRRIDYDLLVQSHQGKLRGVITHGGTIEAHETDIDIEVGGTIDVDVTGSRECPQVQVNGLEKVEEGLYLSPGWICNHPEPFRKNTAENRLRRNRDATVLRRGRLDVRIPDGKRVEFVPAGAWAGGQRGRGAAGGEGAAGGVGGVRGGVGCEAMESDTYRNTCQ